MAKRKKSTTRHRVSIKKVGKGKTYTVSSRSPFSSKRGVTISNPAKRRKTRKKGFLRSNPGSIKKAFSVDALLTAGAVVAGGLVALVAVPKIASLVPATQLANAKKYQGGVALVGGLVGQHLVSHPKVKAALLGVAGIGGIDLVVKTIGSSFVPGGVSLLAGDDEMYPMNLSGLPEVGAPVEVGAYLDDSPELFGAGLDYSMAGFDLTM